MNRRSVPGRRAFLSAVLTLHVFLSWWIGADVSHGQIVPVTTQISRYCAPTAPESLVANLQVSYRRREVQEYAKILAPEFIFKFQPLDAITIGKEFWTRDEDSTGTGELFRAQKVSDIRIDLLLGPVEPANQVGMPADAKKIRILQTDLQVDNFITFLVTDQQDMFFRPGRADAGEDTTHWFLIEWRDLPSLSQVQTGGPAEPGAPSAVEPTTWGMVKATSGYTPNQPSTWGRLKRLFRLPW
jgi:hypothetical protein